MGRRSRGSGEGVTAVPPKRARRYNLRSTSSRAKRDKALGGEQDGRRTLVSDEEFREKNAALKVESAGSAMKVVSVDLQKEKNRTAHHTDEFEQEDLIIRRGQSFSVVVKFDRKVLAAQDLVILQFSCGSRPQESKGSLIRVPVKLSGDAPVDGWTAAVISVTEDTVSLDVTPEPDCMIGKYEMFVETKLVDSKKDYTRHVVDDAVYVLFNSWCKDDVVYVPDTAERNEYVLNDTGRIWMGSARKNYGRPWNFGQFETPVLEVTLGLLDKGELADSGRTDPSTVIRCLSALANSMDDEGVLEGRWTSEYPKGCTKPWAWTGSVGIIEEYHQTGKTVQYGQCWVFSGLITTLLRCLGIPTRSVTNFESAHDSDCSMTIDFHFDEQGESIDHLDDSVWNFHVWNESYYKRMDLPEGYDGWQVHDATPQEVSEGVMRCGPAPLKAVKEGHVYLNFDVGFIFSEVNGDKIEWAVGEDGGMEVFSINKYSVGRNISTKSVGTPLRHDLTWDYKYYDGSPEERRVVAFVNRFSTRRKNNIYKQEKEQQVEMDVVLPEETIGEDIEVGVKVKNITKSKKNMRVRLAISSTFYTGIVGKKAKGETVELELDAGEEKDALMTVPAEEYEQVMNPEALFKLTATCRVLETNRMFVKTESFTLNRPALVFEIPKKVPSFTETVVKLTFKNTTDLKLHSGVFHVEGSHLVKAKSYNIRKIIHPDDEISVDVTLYPRRYGERTIMATFSSDELTDLEGEATVTVIKKSDWEAEAEEEPMETEGAGAADDKPVEKAEGGGATQEKPSDDEKEAGSGEEGGGDD